MPRFLVEIPVRVTREKEFAVDREPAQDHTVKLHLEADNEEEVLYFVEMLLLNELDGFDEDDSFPVLS